VYFAVSITVILFLLRTTMWWRPFTTGHCVMNYSGKRRLTNWRRRFRTFLNSILLYDRFLLGSGGLLDRILFIYSAIIQSLISLTNEYVFIGWIEFYWFIYQLVFVHFGLCMSQWENFVFRLRSILWVGHRVAMLGHLLTQSEIYPILVGLLVRFRS
jgi:hypothetical protein